LYGLHAEKRGRCVGHFRIAGELQAATHCFGVLSVVTYNHWKIATVASDMTRMGSTLSRKSLTPG
jgi:hypothetical protein